MISVNALRKMDPVTAMCLIIQEIKRRTEQAKLQQLYPDDGPLRRELYIKHLKMFAAGKEHLERGALGGNRVGKTLGIGGYETALHLTGLYPRWWEGHRITRQCLVWAAGTKAIKVRDTNQRMLLGNLVKATGHTMAEGGLVPAAKIIRLTRKSGVADAVDQAVILHRDGYENVVTFKSYEEGRQSFESEAVDFIWLDEECSKAIYDECKMRLLTTRGRMLSTYTPIEGMTETTISLLQGSDIL